MKKISSWILLIRDATYFSTAMYLERALQKEHNVVSIGINPWYPIEPKVYPKKIKKKIDFANQQRNDLIDKIDELLENKLTKYTNSKKSKK